MIPTGQVKTPPIPEIVSVSPLAVHVNDVVAVTVVLSPETAPLSVTEALCKFGEYISKATRSSVTTYHCDSAIPDAIDVVFVGLCLDSIVCSTFSTKQFEYYTSVTSISPTAYPVNIGSEMMVVVRG